MRYSFNRACFWISALSGALALAGCSSLASMQTRPAPVPGVKELLIVEVVDATPFRAQDLEADYAGAGTLLEAMGVTQRAQAKSTSATEELQPLIQAIGPDRPVERVGRAVRDQLEAEGIHVTTIEVRPFDFEQGSWAVEDFKTRLIRSADSGVLLLLTPKLVFSADASAMHIDVAAGIYRNRETDSVSNARFHFDSEPVAGDSLEARAVQWSASGAQVFFQQLDQGSTAIAKQCADMFTPANR